MPNLVGIGNSQVPTNAMLGGLAYQDSVGEIDLGKIKARTLDTAVDIFVYDTRKDSDGGAWRHRTQNLSWYNEGASATRGARKEFPAVAVIVAENDILTIYDGDDPNLPMWMVFEAGGANGNNMIGRTNENTNCVSMLNGLMCVGRTSFGFHMINFIADRARFKEAGYDTPYVAPIGTNRNGGNAWFQSPNNEGNDLVNDLVNDVAMTVLPNAPIDASTGLPVPTIAVATAGGTNIINHDGSVTQGYQTIATENVDLHPDGFMTDGISGATNDSFSFYKIGTIARLASYGHRPNVHNITTFLNEGTGECLFEGSGNKIAIAQSLGLLRIEETYPESFTPGNDALSFGLHNRTTSSYNTGWMHGAIKGAYLTDTNDTNLTSTNLVSNGTFDSNTSGWSAVGAAQITHDSGRLKITSTSGNSNAYATVTCVVGERYYFQADFLGHISFHLSTQGDAGNDVGYIPYVNYGSSTTKFLFFTATQTTMYLVPYAIGTNNVGYVDNVICHLADHDRSANGAKYATFSGIAGLSSGLKVVGTVTKSAVATGAELVSYGPFSTSNRLRQPYNSDLNFEANDFSVMFWMYNTGTNIHQTLVGRDNREFSVDILDNSSYNRRFRIYAFDSSNSLQTFDSNDDPFPLNTWSHVCVNYTGGNTVSIYVNGVLDKTGSLNYDIDDTSNGLNIGCRNTGGTYAHAADGTQLALVRIAGSAPSAEQVKKIYNDEKCLYHENAKCTLHGTSDSVTALAFDDTNDVLHIGTSSGRSEFRGLNRINNTTTAVTTAISASDGLVAEQ